MNCPVDYSEEPVSTKAAVKLPLPVNIPIKPQFSWTAASPRECVKTNYLGTNVPHVNCGLMSALPDSEKKKVTWKVLSFHITNLPPPSSLLEFSPQQSIELQLIILLIISKSNVNSAHPIELFL